MDNDIANLGKKKFISIFIFLSIFTYGCVRSDVEKQVTQDNLSNSSIHQNLGIPTKTWDGSRNIECGLIDKDILLFEDFEDPIYTEKWPVYWNRPVGKGTVSSPVKYVFSGSRSGYIESKKGKHKSFGSGEYVPKTAIDDKVYVRFYLRLQDGFSMGSSRQAKLFSIRAGAKIEDTYGGAGKRATGQDKFSVTLAIDNWNEIHLYYYHPDQRKGWGDIAYCNKLFCRSKISTGKWNCIEFMLKANTPTKRDGQLRVWKDNRLIIKVNNMRFRDIYSVKIRRFWGGIYFGGAEKSDTSPKDQRIFIDNLVVSKERIGCISKNP
jgi:hypothetical protein